MRGVASRASLGLARVALVAAVTAVVVGTLLLTANPGPSRTTSGAEGAITAVLIETEPGDYGGGAVRLYVPPTEAVSITSTNNSVRVWARAGTTYSDYYDITLGSGERLLAPGTFEAARPYTTYEPRLDVSGSSAYCSSSVGRFVVHEAIFGADGKVQRFAATFERYCGGVRGLFGEIRFNSTVGFRGVTVTPAQLDLSSGSGSVTVNNIGTVSAPVRARIDGMDGRDFHIANNDCPDELRAGASCVIRITETAALPRAASATLAITDGTARGSRSVGLSAPAHPTASVQLSMDRDPTRFGQAVTLTAQVFPSAQVTGTVEFRGATQSLGVVPVDSDGIARLQIRLPAGTHPVVALYSGDKTYASAWSSAVTLHVNP